MSHLAFSLRYAVRSLLRSGQRGVLAVACVAFGVFSLVSLQLLATSIHTSVLVPPRHELGGDLALSRPSELSLDDLATLSADPDIDAVDAVGTVDAQFVQTLESSRVYLLRRVLAVDPAVYPLVGAVDLGDTEDLARALGAPGSAVLTVDLAERIGLVPGDSFRVVGSPGVSMLTVRGVAHTMPDATGGTILVNRETASRLNGGTERIARARVLTPSPDAVRARYQARGWSVEAPATRNDAIDELFGFALPAAGLLGLLVGGIGIANTLQVLLSRRRTEIATLKTLGYRQRDLISMLSLEVALLGGIGGLLGVGTGMAGAYGLQRIMAGSIPILLAFHPDPTVLVGGLLGGIVASVLFGMIAIVRASSVRPSSLLRMTPVRASGRTRVATGALSVTLFVLFGLLGSLLIGSLRDGFGVITAGIAGLVVFGALMVAALAVIVRLPVPGLPLVQMAMRNLRRQPVRAAASLVALFVGTYAIGVSALGIQNARDEVRGQTAETTSANLIAFDVAQDDSDLLRIANGALMWTDRSTQATVAGPDGSPISLLTDLHGREAAGRSVLQVTASAEGAPSDVWPDRVGEALVPTYAKRAGGEAVQVGDSIRVRVADRQTVLTVVGLYGPSSGFPLVPTRGVVVSPETFASIVPSGDAGVRETLALEVPPERLDATADALGRAFPNAVLVSGSDVAEMLNQTINALLALVLALTSLALVAGTVLVANGVGLALVERRRELGVLKAIGYSVRNVLSTVVAENAVLGLVAGVLGVGATVLSMLLLEHSTGTAISLYPGLLASLVLVAVGLAAGSALAVAWGPVRARPLDVLRSE